MKSIRFQWLLRSACFAVLLPQLPIQAQTNYTPLAFSTLPNSQTLGSVDVAVDGATNVYMVNYNGQTLQKITPDGIITNIAGMNGAPGTNDGFGSAVRFNYAQGVAAAPDGTVYVADTLSHTIRKVTPEGLVTTFAGIPNNSGFNNSPNARFIYPVGIAVDGSGNVYVGDVFQVRKISPSGIVSTLAGEAGSPGTTDGIAFEARFGQYLRGVAVDGIGNVYVADTDNHTIRKITSIGFVTTLAGFPGQSGNNDGVGDAARFNGPYDVGVDISGNVFVADTGNHTIRKITPDRVVTTVAGIPGMFGATDGLGSEALFSTPLGIIVDNHDNIFVSHGSVRVSWGLVNSWEYESNGKWEDSSHWSLGSPSTTESADYITNAATKIVAIDSNTVADWPETLTVKNVRISAPGSDINTLALYNMGPANPLVVQDVLALDGGGVAIVTNSTLQIGTGLIVGHSNGTAGLVVFGNGRVVNPNAFVGYDGAGIGSARVSGPGAVWTNQEQLAVGYNSSGNALVIDDAGKVVTDGPVFVGIRGSVNAVAVTNAGSIWQNNAELFLGSEGGNGNGLFIGNGGLVNDLGTTSIGFGSDNNGVVVTDAGSLWRNAAGLLIGDDSGSGNYLSIANGGEVQVGYATQEPLEIGNGGVSNIVSVTGAGSLLHCFGPLQLVWGAPANYEEFNSLFIASGGKVITSSLVVSNGNQVGLLGGTLETGGTIIHNGGTFPVGIGQDSATLHLNGGVHTFADGLLVTDHSFLTGCGTINGAVTVQVGGTVLADSGCQLIFNGQVTNNGAILSTNSTNIIFAGGLFNYGSILTNSSAVPPQPPACLTVKTGTIMNLADSTAYTVTDGTNSAEFNWSLAGPGASGYVYATFNTDVALAMGVTNIDQVTNAAAFTFVTGAFDFVGPLKDAAANGGTGQFAILRNQNNNHFAVVRFDDVQNNGSLNATWWFQSSGGSNFSCVVPTPPPGSSGAVTNLSAQAGSGNLGLSFPTELDHAYTIQVRTNLVLGTWTSFTNFTGNGLSRSIQLPVDKPQGYYRILTQ